MFKVVRIASGFKSKAPEKYFFPFIFGFASRIKANGRGGCVVRVRQDFVNINLCLTSISLLPQSEINSNNAQI